MIRSRLVQLHYQFKDGHTEFVAQKEIDTWDEMYEWFQDIKLDNIPPDNANWLAVEKDSKYFIKTYDDNL